MPFPENWVVWGSLLGASTVLAGYHAVSTYCGFATKDEQAMNQDPQVLGRVELLRVFPNLRIMMAPIAAMRIRVIGCLMVLSVFCDKLESQSPMRLSLTMPQELLFEPAIHGMDWLSRGAIVILNQGARWNEHLPYYVAQIVGLVVMATVVCRLTGSRLFRGESTSLVECFRFTFRSWRSLLQVLAIGGCLIVLCRILLVLVLGLSSAFNVSSVVAPAGVLLYMILSVVVIVALGLACVAIAYDECSGAEGVSRGLSYVLSRPGLTLFMVATTGVLNWILGAATVALLLSGKSLFVSSATPWNASVLLFSLQLGVWLSGLTIAYVRLREEVDGVPEPEVSH